jgi:hypothetical protein
MLSSIKYLQHVPSVKQTTTSRLTSVTPQKILFVRDLYYQNRTESSREEEQIHSYINYDNERAVI